MGYCPGKDQGNFGSHDTDECQVSHIATDQEITYRFIIYTDTLFSDDTSVQGNKYDQLYADGGGSVHVFPMRSKSGAGDSLRNLVNDVRIMNEIHCDKALEQSDMN